MVWPPLTWGRGRSQPPPSSHPHPLLLLTTDPDPESDPHMPTLSFSSLLTSPPLHLLLFSPLTSHFPTFLAFAHISHFGFAFHSISFTLQNWKYRNLTNELLAFIPLPSLILPLLPLLSHSLPHILLFLKFSSQNLLRVFTFTLIPPPDICVSLQNGKLNYFIIFKTLSISAMP